MKQTEGDDWVGRQGAGAPEPAVPGHGPIGALFGTIAALTDNLCQLPFTPFSDGELWGAAEQLSALGRARDVLLVHVLAEALSRGSRHPSGLAPIDMLRALDPGLPAPAASAIVTVAQAQADARWAELTDLVTGGAVTVANAAQVIRFRERVHLVADPEGLATAVSDLSEKARTMSTEQLARWVRHHTESIRPPKDNAALDAARRASRGLWLDRPTATGMVMGRLTLDPEAAAILTAALDPLSAPRPTLDEHGAVLEKDPRSPATRRADALIEVVQRGVSSPGAAPSTDRAKVVVTIDLDVLTERISGCGHALSGEVLTAATARRVACDAEVIPMVLGTASAPLDVGRSHRLVPPAIRHAAWLRDDGCTWPGCTIPAPWCDAHHVTHWADGGRTSLDNTAMLCGRHHTLVHERGAIATVADTGVTWHV